MVSYETQTPETTETAEAIAYVLDAARREVISMTSDDEFNKACLSQTPQINPFDDIATPAYWDTFANYATQKISAEAEERGGMGLDLDAMRLLAETPRYLFVQTELHLNPDDMAPKQKEYARGLASSYNDQVRSFVRRYPNAKFDDVKKGMLAMAQASIEDELVLQAAGREVYGCLRGTRPELAFDKVLEHAQKYVTDNTDETLTFESAPRELDLKGIDKIVRMQANGTTKELGIDLKSSDTPLLKTGRKDPELPFASVRPGVIMVHLDLKERDFDGTFHISDNRAESLFPEMLAIIHKAA